MFKKLLIGLFIVVNAFSASNVTTIPGSTAIQYYLRNYTYANMSLDLPILSIGLATDLNKMVYRNSIGNLYKIMVDASGSSNTPQNRIFYADVNGSATSSTNFTFNGTDLYINSSNTSTINTGRVTGTDFTVDSLKSTKGINATGGSFSSTVKADSVNSTKNITAPSVKLTNLTSGYFPYQNNSGILANGPIFTNGTNVSVGKSSVEAWSSGFRALQVGANTAIFSNGTELGTADTWFLTNLYFDGAWKPQMSGQSQTLSFGSSGFIYQHDTGVVADVGFTPTTRFSWTLAGGLNVASKGTFTNIASGDTVSAKKGLFDSLKLGSGSYLKTYLDTTFNVRLFDGATYKVTGTCNAVVIGKQITLRICALMTTLAGENEVTVHDLPIKIIPSTLTFLPIYLRCGNGEQIGQAVIGNGFIYLCTSTGNLLPAGSGGLDFCTLTYIK